MFMMVNRHGEILATDGEFYPPEAFPERAARLWDNRDDAEHYQLIIRDYTKILPVEASL